MYICMQMLHFLHIQLLSIDNLYDRQWTIKVVKYSAVMKDIV